MPPWKASNEAVLMILPWPCASINLPAYWLRNHTALRLVLITVFQHSEEFWNTVINTNLNAVWFLSQYAGRLMLAQGHGKIINTASLLAFQGGILVPGYEIGRAHV